MEKKLSSGSVTHRFSSGAVGSFSNPHNIKSGDESNKSGISLKF